MNNKMILGLLLVFFIMIPAACAWSIFDNPVEENTDHIYIDNIETQWTNYTHGFYGYDFNFQIYNLSSSHEIESVVSFYDSYGEIIKNENFTGGIYEPILHEKITDNVTITIEDDEKADSGTSIYISGEINNFDYFEVDHIKIDIIDVSEDKLLYSINHTFNMSNLGSSDDIYPEEDSDDLKSDSDYEFFEDTDSNGDGLISFEEFTKISYVFTEDSFWDGYSIEEILQSEWDRADTNGDDYLTFKEFKNVI